MIKKKSQFTVCFVLICFFILAVMLYCNFHTSLLVDDYFYLYDFRGDLSRANPIPELSADRIRSVWQIFPSMSAHWLLMNGRLAPHFLVQLFLMMPKSVFSVVNSFFLLAEVLIIYKICIFLLEKCEIYLSWGERLLIFSAIFPALWLFLHNFGHVNLWLDGSINYLWCCVFSLITILIYIGMFFDSDCIMSPWAKAGFFILNAIVGSYSENAGGAMIIISVMLLLCKLLYRKERPKAYEYISIGFMIAGFLFMFLSPSEFGKVGEYKSIAFLIENFITVTRFLYYRWPLCVSVALLYILAIIKKVDLRVILVVSVLLLAAVASCYSLILGVYISGRSFCFPIAVFILCDLILAAALMKFCRKTVYTLIILLIVCLPHFLYIGMKDIGNTYAVTSSNEEILIRCGRDGINEVSLPFAYAETDYSAMRHTMYLDTSPDAWPNCYMAKYYGVDKIYREE